MVIFWLNIVVVILGDVGCQHPVQVLRAIPEHFPIKVMEIIIFIHGDVISIAQAGLDKLVRGTASV